MEYRHLSLPSTAHTWFFLEWNSRVPQLSKPKVNSKATSSICFNYTWNILDIYYIYTCKSLMQLHKSSCVQELGIQWILLLNFQACASSRVDEVGSVTRLASHQHFTVQRLMYETKILSQKINNVYLKNKIFLLGWQQNWGSCHRRKM